MEQWGDVGQVFAGNGGARLPESVDDSGNLERVPYQDGVGYQAQAARLIHDHAELRPQRDARPISASIGGQVVAGTPYGGIECYVRGGAFPIPVARITSRPSSLPNTASDVRPATKPTPTAKGIEHCAYDTSAEPVIRSGFAVNCSRHLKLLLRRSEPEEKTGQQKSQGHHNHADLQKTPPADLKVRPSQGDEPQNRVAVRIRVKNTQICREVVLAQGLRSDGSIALLRRSLHTRLVNK
jgi:hypothetical protein